MSKKLKIEVDRDTLSDIWARLLCLKSQMIALVGIIDDIPSKDTREIEYQSKVIAMDMASLSKDSIQRIADLLDEIIALGGGVKKILKFAR